MIEYKKQKRYVMKKAVVIYRSKSGYTKKYAEWIAQESGAELRDARYIKKNELMKYDTIVFGGALYATGINGIKIIKKNIDALAGKKIIVFTLGATPVRENIRQQIMENNFSAKQLETLSFFMLRGGFSFSRLTAFDKVLMLLLKIKLKSTKNPTADERGMLQSYSTPVDFTNKKYIIPILDEMRK